MDEYQDTNLCQLELLKLLAGERQNVCAVGDDDQAIYGWRGAEVKNILRFERHFPGAKEVRLEQNYRSTGRILACANGVIAKNAARKPKKLWTAAGDGEPVRVVACAERGGGGPLRGRGDRPAARARGAPGATSRCSTGSTPSRARSRRRCARPRRRTRSTAARPSSTGPRCATCSPTSRSAPPRTTRPRWPASSTCRRAASATPRWRSSTTSRWPQALPLLEALRRAGEADGAAAGRGREDADFVALLDRDPGRASAAGGRPTAARAPRRGARPARLGPPARSSRPRPGSARWTASTASSARWSAYQERNARASLATWLQRLALDSRDEEDPAADEGVTLMTLHAAKGLEFPVVFLVGVEEDLLPCAGIQGEARDLDEERRLAYVGITRARELLYLTRATQRVKRGKVLPRTPSRFLEELPRGAREGRSRRPGGHARGDGGPRLERDGRAAGPAGGGRRLELAEHAQRRADGPGAAERRAVRSRCRGRLDHQRLAAGVGDGRAARLRQRRTGCSAPRRWPAAPAAAPAGRQG